MHHSFQLLGVLSAIICVSVISAADCPAGSFVNEAGDCVPCVAGTYSSQTNSISCRKCPGGTASDPSGKFCIDCQAGFYSTWGSGSCSPCSVGTYSEFPKSAKCDVCASGTYAKTAGSSACNSEPYCKDGYMAEIAQYIGDPLCAFDPEYRDE